MVRNPLSTRKAKSAPVVDTSTAPAVEATTVEAPATTVEATPAQVEAKAKAKRYASVAVLANPNAVISYLVSPNPRKPGTKSAAKFALFEVGMSVAQVEAKFVEARFGKGKARNQLRWDIEHGYVALSVPGQSENQG